MDVIALQSVFPKTIKILAEKRISYLEDQFKKTLKNDLLLNITSDLSRYFPVFLKMNGVRSDILEVAEFEYLKHAVKSVDMGQLIRQMGTVALNPSIQFVELHHEQPKLNRKAGLYCFYKIQQRFFEIRLGLAEALLIDLLQDGKSYSINQLAAAATLQSMGSKFPLEYWTDTITEVIRIGILVCELDL